MNSATNGVAGLPYISAGGADLLDLAAVHDGDPVGDRERLLLVVGDVDRRDPELELDPADLLAQLHAHLRVERRERLVEQQHAAARSRARGRARRAAACRPRAGAGSGWRRRRARRARAARARARLRSAFGLLADPEAVLDVAARRSCSGTGCRPGRPCRCRDGSAARRSRPCRRQDPPRVGPVEARDEPQRGRLAAAGRPEQRDELARLDVEVDALRGRRRRRTSGTAPCSSTCGHQCLPRRPRRTVPPARRAARQRAARASRPT